MFQARHYRIIALVLADAYRMAGRDPLRRAQVDYLVGRFAETFIFDNPRFDRARFVDACCSMFGAVPPDATPTPDVRICLDCNRPITDAADSPCHCPQED
jgi:hypothetical protein